MRSKAPLALMEQLVMILVFAMAAALCLQVFVFADRVSAQNEQTDRAVLLCQNAAETLKAAGRAGGGTEATLRKTCELLGGTSDKNGISVFYDGDWNRTENTDSAVYSLRIESLPSPVVGLCRANVRVEPTNSDAPPLFEITVAWQEVALHG